MCTTLMTQMRLTMAWRMRWRCEGAVPCSCCFSRQGRRERGLNTRTHVPPCHARGHVCICVCVYIKGQNGPSLLVLLPDLISTPAHREACLQQLRRGRQRRLL